MFFWNGLREKWYASPLKFISRGKISTRIPAFHFNDKGLTEEPL